MHRHVAQSGRRSYTDRANSCCAVALGAVALLLGCAESSNAQPPDGGDAPVLCPNTPTCDGAKLRSCHEGVPATDDCALSVGACSRGRCVTAGCAAAERDRTAFAGCQFYTVEVDNVASDAAMPMSFLVTNSGIEAATVTLEQAVGGGAWMATGAPSTIGGGEAARLSVAGFMVPGAGVKPASALRVSSNQPVTVAQIQSDDSNDNALSSGGTMLLPLHVLGEHYLVMTYPQADTPAIDATPGGAGGAGRLLIVGTQPGTHVTFRVSRSASAVVAGTLATVVHDAPYELDLGEGDVFEAWSGGDGQDLSGSEILANRPIAVFSGNITTTYGKTAPGINSPDMAHEQMPPVFAWSYKYVAAGLPPQAATCDTLLGKTGASVWRMLAVNDNTRVEITGPPGAASPPPAPPPLSAGDVAEIVAAGDFVVSANYPLLITQGIDCEPSLSLAISADKLLEDLTFAVLPSFDQVITVARESRERVLLDGFPIDETLFVPAGDKYEVARVPLQPCSASRQVCLHRLQGRFGLTVRGMDVLASYALTAPAWAGCVDPLDLTCIM